MEDSILVLLIVGIYALIGVKIVRAIQTSLHPAGDAAEVQDEAEPATNFEHLTVREQIAETQRISDAIAAMDQLQNDLAECDADLMLGVRIEWLGRNGIAYQHDVLCDGTNTATECLQAIAERESHDLRATLSANCQVLAYAVRHTQNGTQNDRQTEGEW